ncbi:unnamed protein product [Ixodes hexagonus]
MAVADLHTIPTVTQSEVAEPSLTVAPVESTRSDDECQDLYLQSVYRLDTLDRACNEMRYILKDVDLMERRLRDLQNRHSSITKKINCFQTELDKVDERQRRCNVVVFGLDETEADPEACEELVLNLARTYLMIDFSMHDIVSAYRLKSSTCPRPVLVKLSDEGKKAPILKASVRLRGTGIGIREDYSYKVRQQRRVLTRKMHEERRAGRRASLDCGTLKVEGKVFVCDKYCEKVIEVSEDGVRVDGIGGTGSSTQDFYLDARCLSRDWLEKHSKMISEKIRIIHGSSG